MNLMWPFRKPSPPPAPVRFLVATRQESEAVRRQRAITTDKLRREVEAAAEVRRLTAVQTELAVKRAEEEVLSFAAAYLPSEELGKGEGR